MNWQKLTRLVVPAAFLTLLAYEFVVLFWGTPDGLISPAMLHFISAYMPVGFGFGVLVGHFATPHRSWMPWPLPPTGGIFPLLGLAALLGIAQWHFGLHPPPEATVFPGILLGHLCWAQRDPKEMQS